ncbi:fec operon regulator FecR [compost metagenome]|uniref:FecR family protein n=1 Tax=Pedobacter sp. ok626 TaxID=1761882 RepID=UPI000886B10E|nr:FecR family protein [Pedobacter sp. ok626]SDJ93790.1 FecR family protein [Pedobacter sp. ok626]
MNTNNIKFLYKQYLKCRLSPSELMELKQLLANEDKQSVFNELIDRDWDKLDEELSTPFPEERKAHIFNTIVSKTEVTKSPMRLWKYIAAAAAIVIILTGAYFINQHIRYKNEQDLFASKITPGTSGGTLTLPNGKIITLAEAINGELLEEDGVTVTKTSAGELIYGASQQSASIESGTDPNKMNKLQTAKGQTYILTLPDKSKVWLNAESSIHFPSKFSDKNRKVNLVGEAYFEIFKDAQHPFLVESGEQTVEVLGTHFNISAYHDEGSIKTTLLEGAVKVSSATGKTQTLKPDQQAVYDGKSIVISPADTETVVDWKNGYFIFKDEDFKTAMRKIARWYDVEIVYDTDIPIDLEPGGWISRKSDIRTILNRIEATSGIHFKLEEGRITVTK